MFVFFVTKIFIILPKDLSALSSNLCASLILPPLAIDSFLINLFIVIFASVTALNAALFGDLTTFPVTGFGLYVCAKVVSSFSITFKSFPVSFLLLFVAFKTCDK